MHAHNTRTPRGRVAGTADPAPYAVEIAASLQNTRNGSLVIWSSWRQTYTAFSAITPDPHIRLRRGSTSIAGDPDRQASKASPRRGLSPCGLRLAVLYTRDNPGPPSIPYTRSEVP